MSIPVTFILEFPAPPGGAESFTCFHSGIFTFVCRLIKTKHLVGEFLKKLRRIEHNNCWSKLVLTYKSKRCVKAFKNIF